MQNLLLVSSYIAKTAGFIATLDALPFVSPMVSAMKEISSLCVLLRLNYIGLAVFEQSSHPIESQAVTSHLDVTDFFALTLAPDGLVFATQLTLR